ncbi:MAG: HAD family hydrolase [Solobacterium sp.]|nr:HAD family hydrolase [Solobacterium sp.]
MSVLFFDIDNTLLSHRTFSIPESALTALKTAKENGHLLFLCSGRSAEGLKEYYDPDLFDGVVASSGANGVFHQKQVFHHTLAREDIEDVIALSEEYKIGMFLQCLPGSYMNRYGYERLVRIFKNRENVFKSLGERRLLDTFPREPAIKMDIFFTRETPVHEVLARIPEGLEVVSLLNPDRNDYGSELTVKGITKGSGILEMMEVLGKDSKDSYGFGDSENDLSMMKASGIGVAMGNAEPSVKEAADYITKDIEEDGIFHAMKHFELI